MSVTSRKCYYRAFDFLATAIKIGIVISLLTSAFLNSMLYEFVWYFVLITDFVLLGLITFSVLFLLGEKQANLDNIYFYLAYPAGATLVLVTVFTSSLHIAQNSMEILPMIERWLHFLKIEHILTYGSHGYQVLRYTFMIAIFLMLWSFWIFAWMMKYNLNIRLWKIMPSLLIAFTAIILFTKAMIDIEVYLIEKLPDLIKAA